MRPVVFLAAVGLVGCLTACDELAGISEHVLLDAGDGGGSESGSTPDGSTGADAPSE